jgi:hypothetical protein
MNEVCSKINECALISTPLTSDRSSEGILMARIQSLACLGKPDANVQRFGVEGKVMTESVCAKVFQ